MNRKSGDNSRKISDANVTNKTSKEIENDDECDDMEIEHVNVNVPEININKKTTKLDKKHFCIFCEKAFSKLRKHLEKQHYSEPGMFSYMSAVTKEEKNAEFSKLRNKGDHLHNIEVIKSGSGTIVTKRKVKGNVKNEDFIPCAHCLGYFFRRDLWRHKCTEEKSDHPKGVKQAVREGALLLPAVVGDDASINVLFESFRRDEISLAIKNDILIRMLAKRQFSKNGHDKDRHAHIRNKLRELGRLLLEIRKQTLQDGQLQDFIKPAFFQDVLQATKTLCGFTGGKSKTPTLGLKIGHSLQQCCILLKGNAIETKNEIVRQECDDFQELYRINWETEVSSQACRTLYESKKNSSSELPLTEDVSTLASYISSEIKRAKSNLQLDSNSPSDIHREWTRLAELTLTSVIMFNRRRQGEASKMKCNDYIDGLKSQIYNSDVLTGLSAFEQALCKKLTRIEIIGKRGRIVPVILTKEMKTSMDTLLCLKEQAGVSSNNTFFFAIPNKMSEGHIRGSDVLRKLTNEIPLQKPELLRSTKLRKQIATLSQLVNLSENELDVLAQFMGHDIRTHREHYRLPSGTLQVSKVAKLLLSLENGQVPTTDTLHEMDHDASDESDPSDSSDEDVSLGKILDKKML